MDKISTQTAEQHKHSLIICAGSLFLLLSTISHSTNQRVLLSLGIIHVLFKASLLQSKDTTKAVTSPLADHH